MEEILHHLGLLKPINNGIIIILGGAGFCPSTVSSFPIRFHYIILSIMAKLGCSIFLISLMVSRWIGWHEVPIGRQPQPLPALEDLLVFCGLQDVHFAGDNSSDAPPCKLKMKPENHHWHLFEDEKATFANTLMFEFNMLVFDVCWGCTSNCMCNIKI